MRARLDSIDLLVYYVHHFGSSLLTYLAKPDNIGDGSLETVGKITIIKMRRISTGMRLVICLLDTGFYECISPRFLPRFWWLHHEFCVHRRAFEGAGAVSHQTYRRQMSRMISLCSRSYLYRVFVKTENTEGSPRLITSRLSRTLNEVLDNNQDAIGYDLTRP